MIALCRKLPSEINDFLLNTDEAKILKHFTERKLSPLTLMATNEDKIRTFAEMRESLNSFR